MASRSTVALDGSTGRIHAPNLNPSPPTSVVEVSVDGVLHELYALPTGTGKRCTEHVHSVPNLDEEYQIQGGTLRVGGVGPARVGDLAVDVPGGSDVNSSLRLRQFLKVAVWEGAHHDAVTHQYWASTDDLVAFLELFELDDQPEGLVATPRSAKSLTYSRPASLVEMIPGIGLTQYERLTPRSGRVLPKWQGKKTSRGAELFAEGVDRWDAFFVLATDTALGVISPDASEDLEAVAQRLDDVAIVWG